VFPYVPQRIQQVRIPSADQLDQLPWKHSTSGELPLKEAYEFKHHQFQELPWAKIIWNIKIRSPKSLFVWRLLHCKLRTDDNLMSRGCNIPSMCSICLKNTKITYHLFFDCPLALRLWSWLSYSVNLVFQFSSLKDIWKIVDKSWSPQCKILITATLINVLNTIWYVRNQARFNHRMIPWKLAVSMIIASSSLFGNSTSKTLNNSIRDFTILKTIFCNIHQPKPQVIKGVLWHPPLVN